MATAHLAPTRTEVSDTVVLGELLSRRRAGTGLTLPKLAASTGLTEARIAAVETGRHDLDDRELNRLLKAYPLNNTGGLFSRLVVEVNLDGQWVAMHRAKRSAPQSPPADQNLVTYLSLVYDDRALEVGSRIPVRSVDLSVLRPALAIRRDEVEVHLDRLNGKLPAGLAKHRGLLAVAAAAITVAAIVTTTSGAEQPSQVERPTDGASQVERLTDGSNQIDPRIDIGTALVVERSPQEALNTEEQN